MAETARIERIWIKTVKRGPMNAVSSAELEAGSGLRGNADQGGKRQVTLISRERWDTAVAALGRAVDPSARRANVLVSGLDLEKTEGRVLWVGSCRVLINGETRPCGRMDEAWPGLQRALVPHWGGGAHGEVLDGGVISVGDEVRWED